MHTIATMHWIAHFWRILYNRQTLPATVVISACELQSYKMDLNQDKNSIIFCVWHENDKSIHKNICIQVVSIIRIETICGPLQLPSFHNSFPVIRTANAKNRRFHIPQPTFLFPLETPLRLSRNVLHGWKGNSMLAKPLAACSYLSSIVSELYDA